MGQDIFQCPVFLLLTAKQKKKICNLIIRFSEAKIYRTSRAISSVQFSRSVMSDFLWPHGLKHARPPCPSPTLRACSNSCPSSWWCHQTISSSVFPFFTCLQSFPGSRSFPVSQFFTSGGQTIGVSTSASILPVYIQDWHTGKDSNAGRDWRREKGMTEDEMVGWHYRHDGHEFK